MSEFSSFSQSINCRRDYGHDECRRVQHTRALFFSLFKKRRKALRRDYDHKKGHYVDVYEPALMVMAVGILFLSCADALFTIQLLGRGALEANPIMKLLIDKDTNLFISVKIAITAICIIFIVAHKNFWIYKNRIKVHAVLPATLLMYVVLINYQISMLML